MKNVKILKKWEIWAALTLVIIAFTAPYFFSQFSWKFSFMETGQIGDTIGGITSPFLNLLAAYLVYKSFSAQIQANYNQQKNHAELIAIQQENHNEQINHLINEQSSTYLLALYEKVEKDYNESENKHSRGWANGLKNSLAILERANTQDITKAELSKIKRVKEEILNIEYCIPSVLFTYHNFILLLDSISNTLEKTEDKNVRNISRYLVSKVQSLFNSKGYSYMANKEFKGWEEKMPMSDEDLFNLFAAKDSSDEILKKIEEIFQLTEFKS